MTGCRIPSLLLVWALVAVRSAVDAGILPELSLGVSSDSAAKSALGALEPTLRWTADQTVGQVSLSGGASLKIEEKDSLPYTLWGKIKTAVGGFGVSARVDVDSRELEILDVDLQASRGFSAVRLTGTANTQSQTVDLADVQLTQRVTGPGGAYVILVPRYNFKARKGDIKATYGIMDTEVSVEATPDGPKKLILSRFIGEKNIITPSVTMDGKVALEYRRNIMSGAVIATYKPDEHLDVKWQDGPWEARARAAVDGYYQFKDGIKFSVRRVVT